MNLPVPPANMNVLTDDLFVVEANGERQRWSLTAVIAGLLLKDDDVKFVHLAAEQYGYWWRFLVRCGAKALHDLEMCVGEARARGSALEALLVRALEAAAGGPNGWRLFQPDPRQPGFLQPVTPTGKPPDDPSESYEPDTPSRLTSIVGKKNHERKIDLSRVLKPDELAYALVEHQLGSIYGGRGRYGSQLMGSASGAGSGAPFMGARLHNDAATYRHDVGVLLDRWSMIWEQKRLQGKVWALWTEAWDGATSLPAEELDPAFIPLARLVRVGEPNGDGNFQQIWFRSSTCARVADHTGGGDMGDPFTPLIVKDGTYKVRGTLERGYEYGEVAKLLGWDDSAGVPAPSVAALDEDEFLEDDEIAVIFMGVAFQRGKTGGYHQRRVLMRAGPLRFSLRNPVPMRQAHQLLSGKVAETKTALRGAMRFLLTGEPRPRSGDEGKVEAAPTRVAEQVDALYIPTLLDAGRREAEGDTTYVDEWTDQLRAWALSAFDESAAAIPTKVSQRYEREVRARAWLGWKLKQMRGAVGAAATSVQGDTSR